MADYTVETLAEDALLLRFGEGIDMATNARVHAAAKVLRQAGLPGITDIAPAYASLLIRIDPDTWYGQTGAHSFARIAAHLRSLTGAAGESPLPSREGARLRPTGSAVNGDSRPEGRAPGMARVRAGEGSPQGEPLTHPEPSPLPLSRGERGSSGATVPACVEIPVCYGGECGPDIDAIAEHAGLSRDEVIVRHAAAEYTVAMLGFAPGFPYLLGLDAALHVPRRATPRTRVPAGSVAIGGAQTGIYPRELPGGWHLVGRTPLKLFDPDREPPCLLAPGDRVCFRAIGTEEFAQFKGRDA